MYKQLWKKDLKMNILILIKDDPTIYLITNIAQ